MMAGMICGGWDPYDGGQVYEIPLGKYCVVISGFAHANGFLVRRNNDEAEICYWWIRINVHLRFS